MRLSIWIQVSKSLIVVAALLAGLQTSVPPAQARAASNVALNVAPTRLRIGVTTDGMVRITPSELATALSGSGVDPAAVDPRTFALSSLGQPVAIRVTGESDGYFDSTDRIEFFGQKFRSSLANELDRQMEEKYTDERVYWLEFGGIPGPRVEDVAAVPQDNLDPPTSFPTTVHAEVNLYEASLWSVTYDTRDTWYWYRFILPSGGATTITKTYTYTTPWPAAGFPATVRLEVLSSTTGTAGTNPSHHVTLALAGATIADTKWDGLVRKVLTGSVSPNALTGATTGFDVGVYLTPSSIKESIYINFWELDYRRLFRAYNDQLDFKAENAGLQEFSASDFTSSSVAVWDITDALRPKHLTGVAVSGASSPYAARFRATPAAGDRFWMQTESKFAAPASITLRSDTTWLRAPSVSENAGPGADTVIITPAFLRSAADTLATWHRAHGRRTLVVDLQDVYDEFNNGIRHPVAVRQMLAWAAAHWTAPTPTYLVLMGDGHFNLKNYTAASIFYPPAPNPFPPYLIFKDPWTGEIASDGLFGDYTGDDLPDVAVGRIPVNTLSEANVVVNKIINYDESGRAQPWQRQAIFIADRIDPAAGDFWQLSDEIIQGYTPADLTAQRVYYGTAIPAPTYPTYVNLADAKTAILNAVNSGAFMVQYTGHGASQYWSKESLWTVADVAKLTNGTKLPVILSFNCLDGLFTYSSSTYQSLAETMFRKAGGGSVAAIAPSGEGLTYHQQMFRKIILDTMFKDGVRELGGAFLAAKRKYVQTNGMDYLMYELNLFGDPAMRLPAKIDVPVAPAVTIARNDSNPNQVKLSWPAVTKDIRNTTITVTTYGIWRSTQPYFDPAATNCNCTKVTETASLNWIDNAPITSIGDADLNYFYVVRAQDSAGWSAASNRTGEFDFALEPGS
jgi:hypothetical protein